MDYLDLKTTFGNTRKTCMNIHPYSHNITETEIEVIKTLGFEIRGEMGKCEDFVSRYFHNCDLLTLLRELNDILIPVCQTKIFKSVTFSRTIPPVIKIEFQSEDCGDDERGLILSRIFTWEEEQLVVIHDCFILPASARYKGVGKQVYRSCIQQYVNMGVKRILVNASLQDGGYMWAKYFFTATDQQDVAQILYKSKFTLTPKQYNAIERIYNNYYTKNPNGRAFPIQKWAELPFMETLLRGCQWKGVIDLTNRGV